MMIKKIIAYSFILIASFIMLAHDIIPHHHDDTDAIEQSQTSSSHADKERHHSFPEHEHQHGDYLIVIHQVFASSPNPGRLLFNVNDCAKNKGFDYFFFHTSGFIYVYSPPDYKIPIRDNLENFTNTVTYTFGLRAPPAV